MFLNIIKRKEKTMYMELSAPISVQVELTTKCDNKCRHCYNFWRHAHEDDHSLCEKDLDAVLQQIIDCKVFRVTLTGGEPLLVKDRLFQAIQKLSKNDIGIGVNSNLTHL